MHEKGINVKILKKHYIEKKGPLSDPLFFNLLQSNSNFSSLFEATNIYHVSNHWT